MLLPVNHLEWYGPGCAAGVDVAVATASVGIKATGRLGGVNTSVATSPLNKPTMGKYIALVDMAIATSPRNAIRANARLSSVGKVNELTQDDVSGAVLTSIIEPGLTMQDAILQLLAASPSGSAWDEVIESGYTAGQIMRLLASVAQGDAAGLEGSGPVFKSIDGTKDRVTAAYASGTRTITGRDVS